MTNNVPLGENVLIKARSSRQSKYFNAPKSEFDQTQTVGTVLAVGEDVPAPWKDLVGKLVYFAAFQEVQATADPDEPEVLVKYEVIRGYDNGQDK